MEFLRYLYSEGFDFTTGEIHHLPVFLAFTFQEICKLGDRKVGESNSKDPQFSSTPYFIYSHNQQNNRLQDGSVSLIMFDTCFRNSDYCSAIYCTDTIKKLSSY